MVTMQEKLQAQTGNIPDNAVKEHLKMNTLPLRVRFVELMHVV